MTNKVELRIVAQKQNVQMPFLWNLSREFPNVKFNVLKANIDSDFGWVNLELEGAVEEIQRATAWLMTTGVHIEAQQRAVGA